MVWTVTSLAILLAVAPSCGGHATGSIGAVLGKREDGRLFLRDVPGGMSAQRAGLEPGDEVLAIDGHDVKGMSQDDVRKALRGSIGSTVVLTIQRSDARRDVKVERGPFQSASSAPAAADGAKPK